MSLEFAKGEGTGNDFVVLPDLDGDRDLSADLVSRICDRRFGIGADGVLRVVPAVLSPAVAGADARWFMDYRNADGSTAEMCGNGARVFARYLRDEGLESTDSFSIATRSGVRQVELHDDGTVSVSMGPAEFVAETSVDLGSRTWDGVAVTMPNPHAVLVVDSIDPLDLSTPPTVDVGVFPQGANVEFVEVMAPDVLRMRVHERGVGETLSCGTGACAAAFAHARAQGLALGDGVHVDVPGGRVVVSGSSQDVILTGPMHVVASGNLNSDWMDRVLNG